MKDLHLFTATPLHTCILIPLSPHHSVSHLSIVFSHLQASLTYPDVLHSHASRSHMLPPDVTPYDAQTGHIFSKYAHAWMLHPCTWNLMPLKMQLVHVEQQWQQQHKGVDPRVHWECLRKCKQLKQSMMLSSLLSWAPKITGPMGADWQSWAGDSQQTDPEQPGPD